MPRDGSGVYTTPNPDVVPDTTIESSKYNVTVHDVETDLNTVRPIVAGGTGANSKVAARASLGAEAAKQIVTDYSTMAFEAGSFYSAAGITGAPVAGHAFSGFCYLTDNSNIFIEARDQDDTFQPGTIWVRQMKAGVWSAWSKRDFDPTDPTAPFVHKAGDTMTGDLTLKGAPTTALMASTKQYVDDLGTATSAIPIVRYDAQTLTAAQQKQARANIAVNDGNIVINGDFRVNQGNYVSAAVLAAGAYGHDQWKAGASGGDYSFTQLVSSTQITIASGKSLIQPIEDVNVVGGSYVLSWTGTAQARAGVNTLTPSGAYTASPLLITGQTAGTAMSVEFSTGTLGAVKLESGAIATPFIMRDYASELAACQRYYETTNIPVMQSPAIGSLSVMSSFKAKKRATPTMTTIAGPGQFNATSNLNVVTADGAGVTVNAVAANGYITNWLIAGNARL